MTEAVSQGDREAADKLHSEHTICDCDECISVTRHAFAAHRLAERKAIVEWLEHYHRQVRMMRCEALNADELAAAINRGVHIDQAHHTNTGEGE